MYIRVQIDNFNFVLFLTIYKSHRFYTTEKLKTKVAIIIIYYLLINGN